MEKKFTEWLNENELLMEMATLRPKKSHLPINIYIDDSATYVQGGHGPRIKFEMVKNSTPITRDASSMVTMDLDGQLHYGQHKPKQSDRISQKEIDQIRNFVLNNARLLRLVANEKIDYDDFVDIMIPGGEVATEEQKEEQNRKIDAIINTL